MEQHRHLSPSNSMLVPYAHRHLSVASASASPLTVPSGWRVKRVLRQNGSHTDKYYYEPGSGKKFRSIREVHRYLNGQEYPCTSRRTTRSGRNTGHRKMIVSGGKLWRLNKEALVASARPSRTAPDILPDGWIVEEVPRRYGYSSDKYYYEPETGRKFRSLVAIERYLAELEENENAPLSKTLEEIMENKPLAKAFKLGYHNKSSSSKKKVIARENPQASPFLGPPMEVINWVLASPQGDVWNPFIEETLIPDDVKQQWANIFMLFMTGGEATDFQA